MGARYDCTDCGTAWQRVGQYVISDDKVYICLRCRKEVTVAFAEDLEVVSDEARMYWWPWSELWLPWSAF